MITIEKMQKKSLSKPDETRTFDRGKVELVTLGAALRSDALPSSRAGNGQCL